MDDIDFAGYKLIQVCLEFPTGDFPVVSGRLGGKMVDVCLYLCVRFSIILQQNYLIFLCIFGIAVFLSTIVKINDYFLCVNVNVKILYEVL